MGLESHIKAVLKGIDYRAYYTPGGRYHIEFMYSSRRDHAYHILKGSGEFNPAKVGKYVISFLSVR